MNKKNLFLWSLYDFANSFVFINFLLYFSQWLVIDWGLSDFWYNATFAIATLILLFSAPKLAAYTDKRWHKKQFLTLATIGTAISYWLCVLFAYFWVWMPLIALCFILGQYFYQLSFVFYNPLVEDVADTKHCARAFGIGQFSNCIGQISGLLVALPFIGISRLAPLTPSIIIFIILSIPMLIWFKETKQQQNTTINNIPLNISKNKIILFFTTSLAAPLIIAFFFFNDAFLTVTNNYWIFLEKVFAVTDSTKSILLILIIVASAIGGIVFWWIADRFGQLKTLKGILIGRVICLSVLSVTSNFALFSLFTVIVGLLMGSVLAVSRSYLTSLLKKWELAYWFSFLSISERFASFLWPLVRWWIVWFYWQTALSYRYAMACMIIFVCISIIILIIKKPKHEVAHY